MARIDVYLRSIERFGAHGATLTSGQSVTLRFPTGDRHATQVTPHDQLVIMVREIAPPAVLDPIDRGRPAQFDHVVAGARYRIDVTPRPGKWVVQIDVATDDPIQPSELSAAAAGKPRAELGTIPPQEMVVERTAYDVRAAVPAAGPVVLDDVLASARHAGASDLYLMSGAPPLGRIAGDLVALGEKPPFDAESLARDLGAIASPEARATWHERGDAVFAHESPTAGRMRVHWIRDHRGPGASIRMIAAAAPAADKLGIPELGLRLIEARRGLVLVTGPSGSGKSTTIAALIEHANTNRNAFVVTIETPIEITYDLRRCVISQREVGTHVRASADGVRAAWREGADVIVIGRGDDPDALAAALDAVGGGALVVVGITAQGVAQGIERMIEVGSRVRGDAMRGAVADALIGGVSQALCKRIAGGRIAAFEVLGATAPVNGLIREGKTYQLSSVMQTGRGQGMVSQTDSLVDLVRKRVIAPDEALRRSSTPHELRALLQGQTGAIPTVQQ
jgi:twitching motility protein PilT